MSIQVISFNCVLKNMAGHFISSTFNRDVLNDPETSTNILPSLAKNLKNLHAGEKRSISLKAEDAYGLYEPQKVILYPRTKLPKQLQLGGVISVVGKNNHVRSYKVLAFHGSMVSLDGNHPLAGQDLIFEIETVAARGATAQEIAEALPPVIAEPLLH
jgi:FKBP-type peptidyl-prolyl cis-trans isomerase SlyD